MAAGNSNSAPLRAQICVIMFVFSIDVTFDAIEFVLIQLLIEFFVSSHFRRFGWFIDQYLSK